MSKSIPDEWRHSKISESSVSVSKKFNATEGDNPRYIGLEHIAKNTKYLRQWGYAADVISTQGVFQVGDTLFGKLRPYLSKVSIADFDGICSTDILVIRTVNGTSPEFLYRILSSEDAISYAVESSAGNVMPRTSWKAMAEFIFLKPPLKEQQKIAQILTSVDEVIEKTQAQIDKLKDLKTAMTQELLTKGIGHVEFKDSPVGRIPVGWDCVKMNKIAKVTDGAHFTPTYMTKGVPFLRVTDLKNKSIFNGNIKFIPLNEHEELIKRCNPEKGDILFSKNGTIGLTRLIDWDDDFSIFVSLALIKILSNKVTPEYLTLFMESPIVKYQIKMRSKQGSVTNLHLEEIREFDIPLPSVLEQTEIIKMLSSIINKLDSVEKKHENLVNLKKALMQDLLTGKVRVNTEQSNLALTVG
jgi:type I restriction enzyme S subunit